MAATLTSVLKMNLTGLGFDPDIWYRYAHATAPAELEHGYLQITAGTSIQLPLGQIAVTALFWVVLIARAQTIYVKFDSAGTGNDLDPAADAQILIPASGFAVLPISPSNNLGLELDCDTGTGKVEWYAVGS